MKKKSKEIELPKNLKRKPVAEATAENEEAKPPQKEKSNNVSTKESESDEKIKMMKKKSEEIEPPKNKKKRPVAETTAENEEAKPPQKGKRKNESNEKDDKSFATQCRPQGLSDMIKLLSEKQKTDIESIGFGGLLKMSINQVPTGILKQLVANFHSTSRMLKINDHHSFVVTADDVCDVLLLPRHNGNDVIELKHSESLVEVPIILEWKRKYNLEWNTPYKIVKDLILSMKDGGDDFKRLFVVFSLSSFLAPNANRTANFNAVKSLLEVDRISSFDWSSYVLKRICTAAFKYNNSSNTSVTKHFSGCGVVLLVLYFHRLKWQGLEEPSTIPLIQHWSTDKIRKRVREELETGMLGMGEWVSNVYPICSKDIVKSIGKDCQPERVPVKKLEMKSTSKENVDPPTFITFPMPEGVLTDSQIKESAKDDVHASIMIMNRDIHVMMDYHMKNIIHIKEKMKADADILEAADSNDSFYANEEFFAYLDKVEHNYKRIKEVADDMPSFKLLPDFDDEVCEEATDAIKLSSCKIEKAIDWNLGEEVGYVSNFVKGNNKLLESMKREEKEIVDYCMFVEESPNDEEVVFSVANPDFKNYFITRKDMMSITPFEKIWSSIINAWSIILNYSNEINRSNRTFYFDLGHSLYVSKIIYGDEDEDEDVEDDEGKIVEKTEINEVSVVNCWKSWKSLNYSIDIQSMDMIFVPIHLNDHFFAAVINFRKQSLQYLDNRKYSDPSIYIQAVEIVRKQMSVWLKSFNHPESDNILTYKLENVAFSWQTKKPDLDCGIFLMNHMEFFEGDVYYTPDLGKALVRRALRASYCARIVVSDVNRKKLCMQKKVAAFCKRKPLLMEMETNKKRAEVELKTKKKNNSSRKN